MAGLRADLAIGEVQDNEGKPHSVTVAVLIGPNDVVWKSTSAWGVGPGSALAGVRALEDLQGDIEFWGWDNIAIDWSVIEQVRYDLGE